MTRLRIILLGAAVALVAGAAAAYAATSLTYSVNVTPTKAGTVAKPRNVGLHTTILANGSNPSTTSKTVLYFDKNIKLNGKLFKSCSQATLLSDAGPSACPKGSKIGSGTATGHVPATIVSPATNIPLTVTAYNGPSGKKIELYVKSAPGSFNIQTVLEGTVGSSSGLYGKTLTVNIPAAVQQPIPGLFVALTKFDTTINATTKIKKRVTVHHKHKTITVSVGYLESTGCPASKAYNFKAAFTFANNGAGGGGAEAPQTLFATSPCNK
jgi:hypothetical protein